MKKETQSIARRKITLRSKILAWGKCDWLTDWCIKEIGHRMDEYGTDYISDLDLISIVTKFVSDMSRYSVKQSSAKMLFSQAEDIGKWILDIIITDL